MKDGRYREEDLSRSTGDFLYLCEPPSAAAAGPLGCKLVLPVLIERKTPTDFLHSLADSRFARQLRKMNASGLARKVYLMEGFQYRDRSSRWCEIWKHDLLSEASLSGCRRVVLPAELPLARLSLCLLPGRAPSQMSCQVGQVANHVFRSMPHTVFFVG